MYDKLERECHDIDVLIYKGMMLDGEVGEGKNNFEQIINKHLQDNNNIDLEIEKKEEELEDLLEDIPLQLLSESKTDQEISISPKVINLIGKKNKLQETIKSMVHDCNIVFMLCTLYVSCI